MFHIEFCERSIIYNWLKIVYIDKILVSADYVQKLVNRTKRVINKAIKAGRYEDALRLISICARILYQTNIYYVDDDLEFAIDKIANALKLRRYKSNLDYRAKEDNLLFFDGFGLNDRGLAQIYLKALCKIKKVIYVTYEDRKDAIPDIRNILSDFNCEQRYINRKKGVVIDQISQLNDFIEEFKPRAMFFYSVPEDVIAVPLMFAYDGVITRYQINLTDHAFWLGANCIDKCIEFRNYGAQISHEYRKIDAEKIDIIPFYPIINREKKFLGFPFEKESNQKVIFSGGNLYKTLGDDNQYYRMVEHLLNIYVNAVFWYAGSGDDTEIRKILEKYPQRAFWTSERADLLQILENCDIYLSTYPLCGGLMFQYAAIAGCVPVTLKSRFVSSGFLLDQEKIGIEFDDVELLYAEVNRIFNDKKYSEERSELMKKSVMDSETFDKAICQLMQKGYSDNSNVRLGDIDTVDFRRWYLERLKEADVDAMYLRGYGMKFGMRYFPCSFVKGELRILQRRFLQNKANHKLKKVN